MLCERSGEKIAVANDLDLAGDVDRRRHLVMVAGRRRSLTATHWQVFILLYRHLAVIVAGTAQVVLVQGNGIDETARALRTALDIDWQHAPFSRRIVDNRPLEAAPP